MEEIVAERERGCHFDIAAEVFAFMSLFKYIAHLIQKALGQGRIPFKINITYNVKKQSSSNIINTRSLGKAPALHTEG